MLRVDSARLYGEERRGKPDTEELRELAEATGGDDFDALPAAVFAVHQAQPAARLLDHATGGIFLVRECDVATLQPHAVEWIEED